MDQMELSIPENMDNGDDKFKDLFSIIHKPRSQNKPSVNKQKSQMKKPPVNKQKSQSKPNGKKQKGKKAVLKNISNLLKLKPNGTGEEQIRELVEEEDSGDEDMGVVETYSDYMPSKLKLGIKHPDPVVETASLSSVQPPDIKYQLILPESVIETGALSALQLEAISYAAQQHQHFLPDGCRAGYLIGDGAGVGKGRTVAGCIFENFLKGQRKAVWISVSNDLKFDSERDLRDIGAKMIKVHALNKFKYDHISSAANGWVEEGVIFSTYSALMGTTGAARAKVKSRMAQLLDWCGNDFDGVIVFDECHRAKNLIPTGSAKPTKTAQAVVDLQSHLPKARVVYASATGASEPRNMAYMTRLGIWGPGTPFPDFKDFLYSVEKRGVGAMEIVAMDMKLRGIYIARQLSFHGVTFNIEEIPLSPGFIAAYNDSVALWVELLGCFEEAIDLMDVPQKTRRTIWGQFWSAHQRFFKYLCIAAKVQRAVEITREAVKVGKCVVIGLQSTGEAVTLENLKEDGEINEFVSTAKSVLQHLVEKQFPAPDRNKIFKLLGIKISDQLSNDDPTGKKRKPVRSAATVATKKAKISWSSDSEETTDSDSDFLPSSENNSPVNTDEEPLSTRINGLKKLKKNGPKPPIDSDTEGTDITSDDEDCSQIGFPKNHTATDKACAMRDELLSKINRLGEKLPPNTLDQLIDELGGPEYVAEMTGRKGRVVQLENGDVQYESRCEAECTLEHLNLTEKKRFMSGEKYIAIISEAASSGISLQSDRRALNQRRRVHITLELPWSADRAIQQFGRTHRSNQVNAPEYLFLISDLAGERRFASIVAKRLESLGALTHGDRRATETRDLSQFNVDNKYGRAALQSVMRTVMGYEAPIVVPPIEYKGDFFKDINDALVGVGMISPTGNTLDKDLNINISRFLNRILGMQVELQNLLFQYFTDTLKIIINQAKKSGRYDLGILDLGTAGENVHQVKLHTFLRHHATGSAVTELHVVQAERGCSWEDAVKIAEQLKEPSEGFYLSYQIRYGKQTAILAVCPSNRITGSRHQMYSIYRPNTGLQLSQEPLGDIVKKYRKVKTSEAQNHWNNQYESSQTTCSHAYWSGNCKNIILGLSCEVGRRRRTYNVLAGSVLSVWTKVETILQSEARMQVVRLRTANGNKIVGTLIPNSRMENLLEALNEDAERNDEETF